MKIFIRNLGYTSYARHTWEYAIVNDDWYPPQSPLWTGRGRSRNDTLAQARLKLISLEMGREEKGWKEVTEKAV